VWQLQCQLDIFSGTYSSPYQHFGRLSKIKIEFWRDVTCNDFEFVNLNRPPIKEMIRQQSYGTMFANKRINIDNIGILKMTHLHLIYFVSQQRTRLYLDCFDNIEANYLEVDLLSYSDCVCIGRTCYIQYHYD
jgi:hypothetical protein